MQKTLLNYKCLEVIADPVVKFLFEDNQVTGIVCQSGREVITKELVRELFISLEQLTTAIIARKEIRYDFMSFLL